MKALQLHYTSCRRGQSGSAGFQTRALSAGIRADEQREVERRGVYRPPRNARPDPSDEEMARDFPRALRYYPLESGRHAVTRSCYVGRDYSGRWGNFFAHTLVLEDGQLSGLWPIDLYEWPGWKGALATQEDTDEMPDSLAPVDLAGLAPAESFGFLELSSFVRDEPGRAGQLARMCRALLLGRESSRALVVRDTPLNGLYWIACLQKLFPPSHAAALSSATYQDDPRGCSAINATTGETDFTFDEAERRFRFFEFDLTTGTCSEVADASDDYPALATKWMAEDPGRLQRFYTFLAHFDHREPEPALLFALRLFELAEGGGAAPEGEQLVGMIGFATRFAQPRARVTLLEALGRAAELPGGLPRPEDYEPLIRFLAEGARETGRPDHRLLAFRAWLSLLRHPLLGSGSGLAAAAATWTLLNNDLKQFAPELASLVLQDSLWLDVKAETFRKLPVEGLAFLLRVAWRCLELGKRLPPWEGREVRALLSALVNQGEDLQISLMAALGAVPQDAEALDALSRLLRDLHAGTGRDADGASLEVGRALGRTLAQINPTTSSAVRARLDKLQEWDLLLGEWLDLLDRTGDPLSAHLWYRTSILAQLPGFQEASFSRVAGSLLERLPPERQSALALDWLRDGEIHRLPPELAKQCVDHANRAISLDPRSQDGDEPARLVTDAAHRYRVELCPDRPLLRQLSTQAGRAGNTSRDLHLESLGRSVAALPEAEHARFLDVFLLPALERAGSLRDHQQILLATSGSRPELLVGSYLAFFRVRRKPSWPESLHCALRLWLAFDPKSAEAGASRLGALEETGFKGLLLVLERLKPDELAGVEDKLRRARIEGVAQERWRNLAAKLEQRRRNPLRRLVGLLRR